MPTSFITFYSFKGGVGRTQALANMAVALANRGQDVVMIDMDLESPGLHTFFSPKEKPGKSLLDTDLAHRAGLLEYVEHCSAQLQDEPNIEPFVFTCTHEFQRSGRLRLLLPGRLDDTYPDRISQFSWERFYVEADGYRYMEHLRAQLIRLGADYVLIDSRTGMTDAAMVGTFQLPDIVVVLFALHQQGIDGARRVGRAIERRRKEGEGDVRPRKVLLVPSRVDENGETSLLNRWMDIARRRLQGIEGTELSDKLGERVPYWPRMAYGEQVLDLATETNPLTAAYQKLLEKILSWRETSTPADETIIPVPDRIEPFVPSLRTSASVLKSRVDELLRELYEPDVMAMRLQDMVGWARATDYRRAVITAKFEAFRDGLTLLFEQAGEALPVSLEEPKSAGEWLVLSKTLEGLVDQGLRAWRSAVRQRLLDIEEDESLLNTVWSEVERATEEENLDEARAKIDALQDRFRTQSLFALLGRNQLEPGVFAQRVLVDSRYEWIRGRIQYLLDESPWEDQRTALAFWNLLRLRLHFVPYAQPTPQEWSAYDFACLYFEQDPSLDTDLFRTLGVPLWKTAWLVFFRELKDDSVDVTSPAGTDARAQLARIAKDNRSLLDPVVQEVAAGLREVFNVDLEARRNRFMAALFERRRDDPSLRAAVVEVARDGASVKGRRRLLAHWFSVEEPVEAVGRTLASSFFRSLVEDGSVGDAFHGLVLMARRDPLVLYDDRNLVVLAAFSEVLIEGLHWEPLGVLLSDATFVSSLLATKTGQGLMAAVAGDLLQQTVPEDTSALVRGMLLHSSAVKRLLPESVLEWVRWLEQGGVHDEALAARVSGAVEEVRVVGERGIYGSWPPSVWYENDLKNTCDQDVQRVLQAQPAASLDLNRNIDKWIKASFEGQRARGLRTQYPSTDAHRHIVELLRELDEALRTLNGLRVSYRRGTLSNLLGVDMKKQEARAGLRSWLNGSPSSDTADERLSTRILNLIHGPHRASA